jgi:hypothetical protein
MESTYWRGPDSDRSFALREPHITDIKAMITEKADWSEAAPRFITHIGVDVPPQDGLTVMQACNYPEAVAWWGRISSKAHTLVVGLFMEMVVPTEDEGELLRGSRRTIA